MNARMRLIAASSAMALVLTGCADERGRVTFASVAEFWIRVDEDIRTRLQGLGVTPDPVPDVWGPAGRPEPEGPPHGTLYACRRGERVVVEVHLSNVPRDVRAMATGLKLRNGEAVGPDSVLFLPDATRFPSTAPRVEFDFGRPPVPGTGGAPALCLRLTYPLDRTVSVDASTFSLVLGTPGTDAGCLLGITAGVNVRDGGPMHWNCVRLASSAGPDDWPGSPGPPAPPADAPTVCFRLEEPDETDGPGQLVWIRPRDAGEYSR